MARYCLLGHVDPAKLEEYKARHAAVWPELLVAQRECELAQLVVHQLVDLAARRAEGGEPAGEKDHHQCRKQ